ncbi:MAG TPA: helix-turn-helix domain-containing protein, partial [Mesorhizobium sp.]
MIAVKHFEINRIAIKYLKILRNSIGNILGASWGQGVFRPDCREQKCCKIGHKVFQFSGHRQSMTPKNHRRPAWFCFVGGKVTRKSKPNLPERPPPQETKSERRARQLLSILEAAKRLSVSEATVRRLIREGRLEPVEISPRRVGLLEDELADFV